MNLGGSTPNHWDMYFDEVASSTRRIKPQTILPRNIRKGINFLTHDHEILLFKYHLFEPCMNHEVEYESLITSLEMAISLGIISLNIYGNS